MGFAKIVVLNLLLVIMVAGCQSTLLQKFKPNEFNEQFYIDAKLNFAIKHPLEWKRVIIAVSAPEYLDNTVLWKVENPLNKSSVVGTMLIQSSVGNSNIDLPDILSSFLAEQPELTAGQATQLQHPAGAALKLLGRDIDRGRLTIALQGKQHNFIISLDYPNDQFDKLLPVFQDIVASFTEIIRSEDYHKNHSK